MNYTQLAQALQDWTEVSGQPFVDMIPQFVKNCEQKIYNAIQLPATRKNVTGNLTQGNKYLSAPSDFLSPFSLAVDTGGGYEYLLNKDVNFIREAYPIPYDMGQPKYYALFDANTFIVGPTPAYPYTMELHYYAYPLSIVEAGTSWLGDNYDSALFYGALVEAYVFLKGEPDMLASYTKMFDNALMELKMLGDGKDRRDAYRSGQIRLNVT